MVMSLFSRLKGKKKSASDSVSTPDLSRVTSSPVGEASQRPARPVAKAETVDVSIWLKADLERLSETWSACVARPEDHEAYGDFKRAIHNLYGASGAYGGGALTRLSGSLQRLVSDATDDTDNSALINMHVQACRAAAMGGDRTSDDIAGAVCDALEAQVEKKIAVDVL